MINLKKKKSFTISPTPPFNFDGTFHKPSHFPDELSDWQPGKYWQVIRIGGKIFGIKIEDKGKISNSKLLITLFFNNDSTRKNIDNIRSELIWRFCLDEDLSEFNNLIKKDKRFSPIFKKWLGSRNSSAHNLYELLIIAMVLQNATVKRSVQMLKTLIEKYGEKIKFDGKILYAIWLPEKISKVTESELRNLKIGYRAKFIKKISDDFEKKIVGEQNLRKMDKDSAKKELLKLYGVGPETARILLFEALYHFNTFEFIALWQQKIYSKIFYNKKLVSVNKISKDINRAYGKYSMLAVHYIWEDIFWKRKTQKIPWLEKEIRL